MWQRLKEIFDSTEDEAPLDPGALQRVTAALLVEMCCADSQFGDRERAAVKRMVSERFGLDPDEADDLLSQGIEAANEAVSLYNFTSIINSRCTPEEKLGIVSNLWEVAFADGVLDKQEEYLVRKIADLLHVSHSQFIKARLDAESGEDA